MMRRLLASAAVVLGVLALFGERAPKRVVATPEIAPVQLAEWLRDRKAGLRIIDVRTRGEFDDYQLPRSEWMNAASLAVTSFPPEETVVIISDHGVASPRSGRQVCLLRGGVRGWLDDVMNPTITEDASPAARTAYQRASVVSRYFGGVPRVVDTPPVATTGHAAPSVRRRGC